MPDPGMAFLRPVEAEQRMDMLGRAEPYQLAHAAALTRLQNAQAGEAEMRLQQERAMAEQMAHLGGTPEEQMSKVIPIALRTGSLNFAEKAMQTLSAIQAHTATTEAARARIMSAQNQDKVIKAKLAGDLAAWVESLPPEQRAQAWEQGAVQAFESQMQAKIPDQFRKYDPTLMRAISEQSKTAQQRTAAAEKEAADKEKKRLDDARIRADEALVEERKARAQALREKAARDAKAVGKPAAPKLARTDVLAVMKDDEDLKGLSPEALNHAAVDVTSEARALAIANTGLTESEAVARVIAKKKAAGEFPPPKADTRSIWEKMTGKEAPAKTPSYKPGGTPPAPPKPGDVKGGYRFKGGDPSDPANWEPV